MKQIEVLDAIMGSGKTTGIIQWMLDNPHNKYLYVSPMLTEVEDRIPTACESLGFISPSTEDYRTKADHLLQILKDGDNTSFTHSLFQDLTKEHLELVELHGYVLIVDEEINFIESYKGVYNKFDIISLETSGHIKVDEGNLGRIIWTWDDMKGNTAYSKMKRLCDLGMLYCAKRDREMMVLHLPIELVTAARRMILLTYMFDGSIMSSFMKLKGIDIVEFKGITLSKSEYEVKTLARTLVNIKETRSTRKVKDSKSIRLSASWFDKSGSKEDLDILKSVIYNLSRKTTKDKFLWTCKKGNSEKRKSNGTINKRSISHKELNVDETYLYCGAKATNDYAHKDLLVHAYNRYSNVTVKSYLQDYGSPVAEDTAALSELIQWVWRSAIRNDQPIDLYFLSERMETLFVEWLEEYSHV